MKIVDKYELAECPAGTPFFILNNKYWKTGSNETRYSEGGTIDGSMMIKIGNTFYSSIDSKPMFNGVAYIEPENYNCEGDYQEFTNDILPRKIELVMVDIDSNDFDDHDRFLIFNSTEFRYVIDELEEYYLMLKKNEEIESGANK